MTTSTPKIEERSAQHTVGIRVVSPVSELSNVIPQSHDEVFAWLETQGIVPAGAPIVRYHVIDMPTKLDIEMVVPVEKAVEGNGRITPGILPEGKYASVLYTGDYSGLMEANRVLVDWAKDNGIRWDRWDDPNGDAFRSRFEVYITDPGNEPDPAKWETEIVIKLADS